MKRLILILAFFSSFLNAEDDWLFGLGMGYVSAPAYIGSKKQINKVVPFPYIEYRGKYFNIERDKLYNKFYDKNDLEMEISFHGSLPSSNNNTAREGMPDLDPILKFGPMLRYKINENINFLLPIRTSFAINKDSLFEYIGVQASAQIEFKKKIFDDYNFIHTTGFSFNDKKYNDYYYSVESKYVREDRNEYHSKSGYSGFHTSLALTKKEKKFWYGGFVKYYYLKDVSFDESPLFEKEHSLFYGVAFSYFF